MIIIGMVNEGKSEQDNIALGVRKFLDSKGYTSGVEVQVSVGEDVQVQDRIAEMPVVNRGVRDDIEDRLDEINDNVRCIKEIVQDIK